MPFRSTVFKKPERREECRRQNYLITFPRHEGSKTERYTLAISIDKRHNIKHIFFYDDIKDPYQMNKPVLITENQKIFEDLC